MGYPDDFNLTDFMDTLEIKINETKVKNGFVYYFIITTSIYNGTFNFNLTDLSTQTKTDLVPNINEIVASITSNVSNLTNIPSENSNVLSLDSNGYKKGDVVVDANGGYYKVMSSIGNNIYVNKFVDTTLSNGSSVTKVGNTGDYSCDIVLSTNGRYTIEVEYDGLTCISAPFEVVDKVEGDMYVDLKNLILAGL
jgi:hypothetical protein